MSRRRVASRALLLAYPKSFRRDYGDAVLQSIADMRHYGGLGNVALGARVARDLVRSAPKMRMETLMAHYKPHALAGLLTVILIAAVVGSPVFVLLIGPVVALLVMYARSHGRLIPTDPAQNAHWYQWIIAGVVAFAIGSVPLIIDGPELSELGWTVWAISWASAIVAVMFGLVLVTTRTLGRNA